RSNQLAIAGWMPGKRGTIALWDVDLRKPVREFAAHAAEVLSIAISPDGQTLASGDAEGNLDLWNVSNGSNIKSKKQAQAVKAVGFSAAGQLLAIGDVNRTVQIVDAASLAVVQTLKSQADIEALAFSPDANLLAAGIREQQGMELWNWRSGGASRNLK